MTEMTKPRQRQMPNLWFKLMALEYKTRSSPLAVVQELKECGLRPGMRVLDFGCGPGRYALRAATIVGAEGRVYAVDAHPLAIQAVEKAARRQGLANIVTIRSDSDTGLDSQSMDVVLLYDTLHHVVDKDEVLQELRRVLKPTGKLSYKDHTLNGLPLIALMRANDFRPWSRSGTLSFVKC